MPKGEVGKVGEVGVGEWRSVSCISQVGRGDRWGSGAGGDGHRACWQIASLRTNGSPRCSPAWAHG